eukprot:CAMPEP_0177480768 /NCGR_PEP_ID=MMETSP0369-20130122/26003_1 /TAXON_ID=447022 ORGANISM="Scrippsiella hangoei-like, Strain SHHI-4" /NCGR_SAMPLE_ID=MMETSP0369 /ASSEMBLY_ACC=CAM_ASM_000364 /LENGTH=188 /DNA_ID=CAMNT_0018956501 /DNA_START=26 /DNA_END=590 /DNA_ORIENTATION=+
MAALLAEVAPGLRALRGRRPLALRRVVVVRRVLRDVFRIEELLRIVGTVLVDLEVLDHALQDVGVRPITRALDVISDALPLVSELSDDRTLSKISSSGSPIGDGGSNASALSPVPGPSSSSLLEPEPPKPSKGDADGAPALLPCAAPGGEPSGEAAGAVGEAAGTEAVAPESEACDALAKMLGASASS